MADRIMKALGMRARRRQGAHARPRRHGEHDRIHRGDLPSARGVRRTTFFSVPSCLRGRVSDGIVGLSMLDEITQAVLSRDEIARYLDGSHGGRATRASASTAISTSCGRRSGTRSTARSSIRSTRSSARSSASARTSRSSRPPTRAGRVVYASNHRSHTDYLVEPLVLDDNGIRPPIIAAGINLFGGPARAAASSRHRRDADPPQHEGSGVPDHAEGLRGGAAAQARPLLLSGGRTQLQRRAEEPEDRAAARGAAGRRLAHGRSSRPRSRTTSCSRITCSRGSASSGRRRPFSRELAEMVRYAVGYRSRAFVTFGKPMSIDGVDPTSRREVLDLAHAIMSGDRPSA